MGEIAGNTAILLAGELMASNRGQGTMLGGVSGVRPSEVVILGAGTVGEYATRSALGASAATRHPVLGQTNSWLQSPPV